MSGGADTLAGLLAGGLLAGGLFPLGGLAPGVPRVGGVGLAVAAWAALHDAGRSYGPLLPSLSAALVTSTVLGLSAIDGGALWWPVTLATVALMFVAAVRGQFRTRRPRALTIGRSRTA